MENTDTKIKGIVKAVKKDKKGILLNDDKWYSNNFLLNLIDCNKGDEVEVTLNNKGYLQGVKVLTANTNPNSNTKQEIREVRYLVDSGNILKNAVDLVIAGKYKKLTEATNDLLSEFLYLSECLKVEKIIDREEKELEITEEKI
jgi:hypothetical protein